MTRLGIGAVKVRNFAIVFMFALSASDLGTGRAEEEIIDVHIANSKSGDDPRVHQRYDPLCICHLGPGRHPARHQRNLLMHSGQASR